MNQVILEIRTAEDMESLGEKLGRRLVSGDVVLLDGVLGAGKTTLVRGIARGLGYQGRVSSPTFTLMNIYPGVMPIYHLDYYRLGEEEHEGWEEPYYGDGVTIIEWPGPHDRTGDKLTVDIALTGDDYEQPRRVTITAPSARSQVLKGLK